MKEDKPSWLTPELQDRMCSDASEYTRRDLPATDVTFDLQLTAVNRIKLLLGALSLGKRVRFYCNIPEGKINYYTIICNEV